MKNVLTLILIIIQAQTEVSKLFVFLNHNPKLKYTEHSKLSNREMFC